MQGTILKAQNNDKQGLLYQLAYIKQLGEHGDEKNIPEAIEWLNSDFAQDPKETCSIIN